MPGLMAGLNPWIDGESGLAGFGMKMVLRTSRRPRNVPVPLEMPVCCAFCFPQSE
jgi:hypothetical protein